MNEPYSLSSYAQVLLISEQVSLLRPVHMNDFNDLYVFHKPGISEHSQKGFVSSFSALLPVRESPSLRDYFVETGLDKKYPLDEMISFGRLDKDTSGLLLLARRNKYPKFMDQLLLNPLFKKEVQQTMKLYRAKVRGIVKADELSRLKSIKISSAKDVLIDVLVEKMRLISVSNESQRMAYSMVEIEINEGKFHQVKKMFYAIGHPVCKGGLHRARLGMLTLAAVEGEGSPEMRAGEIRPLFESEKMKLMKLYNEWLISEKARLSL